MNLFSGHPKNLFEQPLGQNRNHFLGVLKTLLERADTTYKCYIASGKKFLYAKILKECNLAITTLLIHNTHLLPKKYVKNAIALLHHLDVWNILWDSAFESQKPELMAVFGFENTTNFPREEVELLMKLYREPGAKA